MLAEPTACVVHGMDVLALRPGSDVLVFGAGPTGLMLTQLLPGRGRRPGDRGRADPVQAGAGGRLGAETVLASRRRARADRARCAAWPRTGSTW